MVPLLPSPLVLELEPGGDAIIGVDSNDFVAIAIFGQDGERPAVLVHLFVLVVTRLIPNESFGYPRNS